MILEAMTLPRLAESRDQARELAETALSEMGPGLHQTTLLVFANTTEASTLSFCHELLVVLLVENDIELASVVRPPRFMGEQLREVAASLMVSHRLDISQRMTEAKK